MKPHYEFEFLRRFCFVLRSLWYFQNNRAILNIRVSWKFKDSLTKSEGFSVGFGGLWRFQDNFRDFERFRTLVELFDNFW